MHTRIGVFVWLGTLALALSIACAGGGSDGGNTSPTEPASDGGSTDSLCAFQTDEFVNIAGSYTVDGGLTDQSGDKYSGDATITQINQNCFNFEWHINGRTRTGTAVVVGNLISGEWQEGANSGEFGGTANDDGTIAAYWGPAGGDSTQYVEILTKQ